MPFMEWRDIYSVGDEGIDRQHRKLFALINDLHRAMNEGHGKEQTLATIGALIDYITVHFSAEEALMKAAGYPYLQEHRNRHNRLTRHVADLYHRLRGDQPPSPYEMLSFLQEWLVDHIIKTDKLFARAIAEWQAANTSVKA